MLPIGVHYEYPFGGMATRPEWMPKGEEDWRRDIAKIKETGFNSIRIRIGMDSDLDEVATLLDISHQAGLTVLFGSAHFYVNDEFVEQYPDSKIIGGDGQVCPVDKNDLRWLRACIDHPVYRSIRDQLLEDCASRFKDHPAVIAWCVHNEPSLGPVANACFCENTLAKYRKRLKEEFGAIDKVNERFGTGFKDFAAARPPAERSEKEEELYIHWREFQAANLNQFLLDGRDIVAKHVPNGLISHNVTRHLSLSSRGQDWWACGEYNLLTMSKYIGTSELTVGKGHGFEVLKAIDPEKPHWVTEFQGGPFPPHAGILYSGKEAEIELNSTLGHGMKGLYFYRWEPLLCGAEPWINGMTEPDGYDTDRRLGIQRAIQNLEPQLELIEKATPFQPSVGIYHSRHQVMKHDGTKSVNEVSLDTAITGAYSLLSDAGYEAAFLVHGPEQLKNYKTVVFPYANDLTDREIEAIKDYLSGGGSAIIDLPANDPEMAAKLAKTFGIEVGPPEKLRYLLHSGWSLRGTGGALGLAERAFGGYCFDERLSPTGETVALTYDDNAQPAALLPAGYDGRLLVTGAGLFYGYGVSMHKATRRVVATFINDFVQPDFVLAGADEEFRPYLEARCLEDRSSGTALLFLMNRCPHKSYSLEVAVKGYQSVSVELPSYDVVRVNLERAD